MNHMTYKELLCSLTFDEIVPCLRKYLREDDRLSDYKIHFDMLRMMEPVPSDGDKQKVIHVKRYEPCENEELPEDMLDAWSIEGELWENSLAKEVVVDEGLSFSDAEVAACCLLHSSFYGFVEEDLKQTFDDWHEDAYDAACRHYLAKYGQWIPTPGKLLKIRRTYHCWVKSEMRGLRSRNRFKGRDKHLPAPMKWRSWKRQVIQDEYKRIVSGIGRFIERITETGVPLVSPGKAEELCEKLFNAQSVYVDSLQSYTGDAAARAGYICELAGKYDAFEINSYCHAIFCISTSPEHPMTMEEMGRLTDCLFLGIDNIVWGIRQDETIDKEIRIDYALYK